MTMRPFQILLIGIFFALAVGGVIIFGSFQGFGVGENPYGSGVVVWGTLDRSIFTEEFSEIAKADQNFQVVSYVQKDPRTFEDDLVTAIAEGRGPDLVVLPHDLLVAQRDVLTPIPFETIPVRSFRDTYVDGAEIFLTQNGIYAVPFAVDPLVLYWNRDIISSKGLANPPATWEELVSRTVPAITERTANLQVLLSAIAFGEYANINNAKQILVMLMLQAGSNLVVDSEQGYRAQINQMSRNGTPPADAALRFYTEFSNPAKSTYSWSRSLPTDINEFLAGDLALYFGHASEYTTLRQRNPNLGFDVATVPQGANTTLKKGYGTFYGFAFPRGGDNIAGSYRAAQRMSEIDTAAVFAERFNLAPVHRATIAQGSADPVRDVFLRSALIARGWLDPDPDASNNVLRQMVEDVTSGRQTVSEAVSDANGRLGQLLR